MDEHQLVQLLESVLAPDTERVKSATAKLRKEYFSSPDALVALIHVAISHGSPQLRQLAAVEARTLVQRHWHSLPAEQQAAIRDSILRANLAEQTQLVRHSLARVVSAIARLDLQDGQWADLPGFLQQAATSQNAHEREIGVYILYTLLDVAAKDLANHYGQLLSLFGRTIQDPDSADVRINTMLALSKLAMVLDASEHADVLEAFQSILPHLVAVLKNAVEQGDEDQTTQAFEVFQTFLGCESQLLALHFKDLLQFMMELAGSKNVSAEARTQALSFLMQSVKYRKLRVQALRLGEPLSLKALEVTTELEELGDGNDDNNPGRSALALLDIMAQHLPPSQVAGPVLNALPHYVNNPDPALRRAGILALAFCVEGAPDFFSTQLKTVFPAVLRLLGDAEIRVRQAALYGLARLADDLADDVGKQHETLVPVLIRIFDDAVDQANRAIQTEKQLEVLKSACGAIDSVFSGIEEGDGAKYVSELVPRLTRMLDQSDIKLKAAAISAVGTVAAASGEEFKPYFEPVINALSPLVAIKDSEDELDLRGIVCEALGSIATAVGGATFQPYVQPLMQATEEALHLDHPRLRETSYILWSTLAKVYKEDFAPFLDGVTKSLFECLQQEETEIEVDFGEDAKDLVGAEIAIEGTKLKVRATENEGTGALRARLPGADGEEDTVVDLDDADSDGEAWEELSGISAVAMEKEIALDVMADVLASTRSKYLPHLEKSIELALSLVSHLYEGVRKTAVGMLWRAYATLWDLFEEERRMEKWQPGLPLKVKPTPELKKLGGASLVATLTVWHEDSERDVVNDINRNIAAVLKSCGPAILCDDRLTKELVEILLSILNKQHACQTDVGENEEADVTLESSELDWDVIDNALDAVASLATALGPTFGEAWKVFDKPVRKYAESAIAIERSSSIGAIAQCIEAMEEACTPYTSILMSLLVRRLSDEDPQTRSNAAFGVGVLCQNSDNVAEVQGSYETILAKLEPLYSQHESNISDNAAGCVARMVLRFPDKVPLDEVLPSLSEALPIRDDYVENEPVWDMIVKLYQGHNATIQQMTPQLVPVLAAVLGPPEKQLSEERQQQVTELVKYLHQQQPALFQNHAVLLQIVNA